MKATRIFESVLYAEDLAAAERFYRDVIGLELVSISEGRGMAFRCGTGVLLVFDPRRTRIRDRAAPAHGAVGAGHVAFLVEQSKLDEWRRHLEQHDVPIEVEVDWPEGGRSIYFRDSTGKSIELAPPTLWGFGTRATS